LLNDSSAGDVSHDHCNSISVTHAFDISLQSLASYGHDSQYLCKNSRLKVNWLKSYPVKQTDTTDRITFCANAVGSKTALSCRASWKSIATDGEQIRRSPRQSATVGHDQPRITVCRPQECDGNPRILSPQHTCTPYSFKTDGFTLLGM